MLIVCRSSGFRLAKLLAKKSDAPLQLKEGLQEIEARSGRKMRRWKGDGDGAFDSKQNREVLSNLGILPEFSSAYDHQQNGLAERGVRTLKRDMRVNAVWSACPNNLWGELAIYLVFTRNNVCSEKRGDVWVTPAMLMTGATKAYPKELMMPFGVEVGVSISREARKGGQSIEQDVGWMGIFVGYGESTGHGACYRIYNPRKNWTERISYNRCTVNENVYPWRKRERWKDKLVDLPVSMEPTRETFLVKDELDKFGFSPEVLKDAAFQYDDADEKEEMEYKHDNVGDDDMCDVHPYLVMEDDVSRSKPEVVKSILAGGVPRPIHVHKPAVRKKSEKLNVDAEVWMEAKYDEIPTIEKSTPAHKLVDKPDDVGKVVTGPRRSQRILERPPPAKPDPLPVVSKPRVPRKKGETGYIDSIRGEMIVNGRKCIVVHWEGHGDETNTTVFRDQVPRIGNDLKEMLREYDLKKNSSEEEKSGITKNGKGGCTRRAHFS